MYVNENERSRDQKLNVQEGSILLYVNVKSSIAIFFFMNCRFFGTHLKHTRKIKISLEPKKRFPIK